MVLVVGGLEMGGLMVGGLLVDDLVLGGLVVGGLLVGGLVLGGLVVGGLLVDGLVLGGLVVCGLVVGGLPFQPSTVSCGLKYILDVAGDRLTHLNISGNLITGFTALLNSMCVSNTASTAFSRTYP